jgi:hypothetical protein
MNLIHQMTKKNWNGVYDVNVIIVNDNNKKEYTFRLSDAHTVKKIEWMIGKHKNFHGSALKLLKENNIKEEDHNDVKTNK